MKKENKFVLTAEGFLEAETELNELKTVRRPDIIKALKEARALGDLSENADYDAARNEQAVIEAKIADLEFQLEHCEIIDNSDKTIVSLGSLVTISYDDGETDEYKIVGSMEADPFNNKISNESPLGTALLKHKIGDKVEVTSPNGSYFIKIDKIA
ncbi:MAG: transcription elongation factor GreA [Bacilli bacterium]